MRQLVPAVVALLSACSREAPAPAHLPAERSALNVRSARVGDDRKMVDDYSDPYSMAAASGAGQVLLIWADQSRLGGATDPLGVRLSRDAGQLDPYGLLLASTPHYEDTPAVIFVGGHFLTAWYYENGGLDLVVRHVELDGGLSDSPRTLVSHTNWPGNLALSAEGDAGVLLTWAEDYAVRAVFLAEDGTLEGADGGTVLYTHDADAGIFPIYTTAAWTGSAHLITWSYGPFSGVLHAAAALVTRDGGSLFLTPPADFGTVSNYGPGAIVGAGAPKSVLWPTDAGIVGEAFNAVSATLGPPSPWVPGVVADQLAAASSPAGVPVAWESRLPDGGAQVSFSLFTPDGGLRSGPNAVAQTALADVLSVVPVDDTFFIGWVTPAEAWGLWTDAPQGPFPLRISSDSRQSAPFVFAGDAGSFFAVWNDNRDDAPGLRITAVDPLGQIANSEGTLLAPAAMLGANFIELPGRTQSWILWSTPALQLEALRLGLDGTLRDAAPLSLGTFTGGPTFAPWGDGLVLVEELSSGFAFTRFDAAGTALDPLPVPLPFAIFGTLASTGLRVIAFDGSPIGNGHLEWIEADGGLTDGGFAPTPAMTYSFAFPGEGAALIVSHNLNFYPRPGVVATLWRVFEDGSSDPNVTPFDLDAGPDFDGTLAATWNGSGWVLFIGCREQRFPDPNGCVTFSYSVPLSGPPSSPVLFDTPVASVATLPGGALLAAGILLDATPGILNERVVLTAVSQAMRGAPCLVAADCASGVCEDGVCCDVPCGGFTGDCRACSVAAGATNDGTCGTVQAGFVCRPAADGCDVAEQCDGTSLVCPADARLSCPDAGRAELDGGPVQTDGGAEQARRNLQAGCGCESSPVAWAALAAAALRRRRATASA